MSKLNTNSVNHEILVHEISKLSRLVQLDAISMPLERIRKQ